MAPTLPGCFYGGALHYRLFVKVHNRFCMERGIWKEPAMDINLQTATIEEKFVLRNLMELCQHDYSEFNGKDIGPYGLFGYTYLDHYWTEPGRYPFLIYADRKIAGFALVRQLDEDSAYSMAEFFILRKFRKQGIGRIVACQIFDRLPGKWEVEHEEGNLSAHAFWKRVIAHYTNNTYQEEKTEKGTLFAFLVR